MQSYSGLTSTVSFSMDIEWLPPLEKVLGQTFETPLFLARPYQEYTSKEMRDYLQDFIVLVFCLITGIQHFSSLALERDICFLSVISQKVFQEAVSFHPSS